MIRFLSVVFLVLLLTTHALAEPEGQRAEEGLLAETLGLLEGQKYFTLEPGFQFTHITSNRLDISGYTAYLPGFLIGNIEVEKARKEIFTPFITTRFGIRELAEAELRVPFVLRQDEIAQGAGADRLVNTIEEDGIGDIEASLLVHFLRETGGWPGISGGIKVKSRTGETPYNVQQVQVSAGNDIPLELPTGTGHWAATPYLTFVKTSDPIVFFASMSYFWHLERNVRIAVKNEIPQDDPAEDGPGQVRTEIVDVEIDPSDYIGYSLGFAFAVNDEVALSAAFDQKFYDKTETNGQKLEETDLVLGSLILGGTYALNDRMSVNLNLGIGLTPDSPDMDVSVKVPIRWDF